MGDLLKRVIKLLRYHPVLWAPCSVAAVLMFALDGLVKTAIHRMLAFFSNQYSVLGGEVPSGDLTVAQHRTMMIMIPMGTLVNFLEICLFVVALFITKELVRMTLAEQRPEIKEAIYEIRTRYREVLIFSIKYMAVMAVFGASLVLLSYLPRFLRHVFMSRTSVLIFALACESCLAWLLLPAAMRLLRSQGDPAISNQQRKLGIVLAVAASAVSMLLEALVKRAEAPVIIGSATAGYAIGFVNTVIINAPQVMLFVALALIAIQGNSEESIPAALEVLS